MVHCAPLVSGDLKGTGVGVGNSVYCLCQATAAAALNDPGILAVYDVGSQDGTPYVVSELLDGETLRDRLRAGALPRRKAIEFAVQIARAGGRPRQGDRPPRPEAGEPASAAPR